MPTTPFLARLSRAREGDRVAIDSLFEEFYPIVQRMVHKNLSRDLRSSRPWLTARFSTGDVVQEVFRSVLRNLGTFAGTEQGAFINYLAMVVRNRLVDAIRFHEAEMRDGRRTDQASGTWGPGQGHHDPFKAAQTIEELQRIQRAMEQFTEREQLLLRARLEGTASFNDLAEQLGYGSESAARRAFFAVQARLAIALGQRVIESCP